MKGHWALTAIFKNPNNRSFPKSETLEYYNSSDLLQVMKSNLIKGEVDVYVITTIEDKI